MDKNTISEILKFDFLKIEVIDLYLTHIHKEEITLPNKNWSKIELELFKSSILNSDLLNSFVNLTHLNLTSLNILDYPDLSNIDTKIYIDNFIKFIKLYAFEFGRKRDPILNKYICTIPGCTHVYPIFTNSIKHYISHFKTIDCNICGQNFKTMCDYNSHMSIHIDHKKPTCSKCGTSFSRPVSLKYHLRENVCNKPEYMEKKQRLLRLKQENPIRK